MSEAKAPTQTAVKFVAPIPPTLDDTRSAIADWLEIQALCSTRQRASLGTLSNVMDIISDNAAERNNVSYDDSDDILDNDIVEEERNDINDSVIEELVYRQEKLGDAYPFRITDHGQTLELLPHSPDAEIGRTVYIFCLLASSIRDAIIQPRNVVSAEEYAIGDVFQVCSCLAAGGYIRGEVASFGWPRATGNGFLPALRQVYDRFGYQYVRDELPEGWPDSVKDGGIDVVAWRDHPDRMPGKIYLLGQCASGKNWKAKSVISYIESLHMRWFVFAPAKYALPAMFIPFTLHGDLHEVKDKTRARVYVDMIKDRFWTQEPEFGIVFDPPAHRPLRPPILSNRPCRPCQDRRF